MPTENPKISAYVPKVIYERFKQFQEERNLSMSQAAIELFAEYFGINLSSSSSQETGSGLLGRIQDLEQVVSDLKQLYINLMDKVDSLQSTSELQKNILDSSLLSEPLNELQDDNLPESLSEPTNKLNSELLDESSEEPENQQLNNSELLTKPDSEPHDSSPLQLEFMGTGSVGTDTLIGESDSSLLSEPSIKVEYAILAKRLNAAESYIKNKRSTVKTTKEFTEWTTKKDADKIAWKAVKEGKKVYFVPEGNLSDEQQASLQEWLNKNQSIEITSEPPVDQPT